MECRRRGTLRRGAGFVFTAGRVFGAAGALAFVRKWVLPMPPASEVEKLLAEMGAVWRLAVHLCEVRHAEVLVQETFLRVFRDPRPLPLQGTVTPRLLLFKILHDVAREYDTKRTIDSSADRPFASESINFLPALPADTDVRVDVNLQAAICALPLTERAVFLLSVVERLRYADIAMIVDASLHEVSDRLHAARSHVASRLMTQREPDDTTSP